MNSHIRILIHEFICPMNSSNTNIFPPLSIKVISMGTTQPTMGGRGNGGWQLQSCRLTGDNRTTSWGGQEQDVTRGGGGGEGKLADVRRRCHKRQCGNQPGQTICKWEVELPVQREAAVHQEAAVLVLFSLWCSKIWVCPPPKTF
jgi:hypothetical protein